MDKTIIIIKGLKLSDFPIIFGSKILPIKIWIKINEKRTIKGWSNSKNWMLTKMNGKITASKDPRKGIKFKKNAKIPNKIARSQFIKNNKVNVKIPVNELVRDFSWK